MMPAISFYFMMVERHKGRSLNYVEYQKKFHNNPPNRFPMNQQNASETDKIPILFIL